MQLIQVDVVCAEAAQAGLGRAADVGRTGAPPGALHGVAELGGDHDIFAARAKRLAKVHLAQALAVDIGGVKKRHARRKRRVDHLGGARRVQPAAEIIAT